MESTLPGACIDSAPHIPQVDFSDTPLRFSTDRFHSPEYHARERELLWMKVWQIAGRADEIPETGDWMEYRIFDQSFVLVRGRDGVVRGFVNACRHRGNAFCEGKGRSARFTCPYHNWSYGLDGKCLAIAKPDYDGPLEEFVGAPKDELGLIEVPVECFAGFVFINPDRNAEPLRKFLGEAHDVIAAFRLEEMIPAEMHVRETIDCNWKVVMDAFLEGYHVQGVHPELMGIVDIRKERYCRLGKHGATTVPFGDPEMPDATPNQQVEAIRSLPIPNFPGLAEVLPRFEELVKDYAEPSGDYSFPAGVTGRSLLQRASRELLEGKGLDTSRLTDNQLSDYEFWSLFPNVYIQLRAGEATAIIASPHPDGNPNRCYWTVCHLLWFPEGERAAHRAPLMEVPEDQHFPYFLALEQDYQQMEVQQRGLRNRALTEMVLTRQEPKVAHLHATLDRWMEAQAA